MKREGLSPRQRARWLRISEWLLVLFTVLLVTAAFELGLRVIGLPEPIVSGWRSDPARPPVHALGWG